MSAPGPTAPSDAATVVVMRPRRHEPEILLIERPATMAFGAGLHAFPGGRVDPGDTDPRLADRSTLTADAAAAALGRNVEPALALALHLAAVRELFEEAGVLLADLPGNGTEAATLADRRAGLLDGRLDLSAAVNGLAGRLLTNCLAPIAHWTTPAFMPRRFSTWFFVADLPAGIEPAFAPREVAAHRWVGAGAALDLLASGDIEMWVPTTSVLERLVETGAGHSADVRDRITIGHAAPPDILEEGPEAVRWRFHAAGGLPGRTCETTLVGRRRSVLVDPGDASDRAVAAISAAVERRRGAIAAIVLTSTDPDHAAGAEAIAIPLGIPVLVAPGAGRHLPYPTVELADGERLPSDVDRRVVVDSSGSGALAVVDGSAGQ